MKSFKNSLVYIEGQGVKRTSLNFNDKIISFSDAEGEILPMPVDAIVCPSFIDEHVHGAGGADTMDANVKALSVMAKTLAKEGTATFLATTVTQSKDNTLNVMRAVKEYRADAYQDGARLLGVHLEGPFISPKFNGAQPLEYIVKSNLDLFDEYNQASGNVIKIVTVAPEEEGGINLIEGLTKRNIIASIGHSSAKYSDVTSAIKVGLKHVTHTFNAQSQLHHREIGVVGSALLCDQLKCELIADTIHVSVPAMQLLFKCKKEQDVILITDSMRAKGLSDGVSELGGQTVYIKDGQARLSDGTLAGSVLTMNNAVKNAITKVGLPFTKAIDCATINPARSLGIDNQTGSIKIGKRADFTVLDKDYNVIYTIRDGEIIYNSYKQ